MTWTEIVIKYNKHLIRNKVHSGRKLVQIPKAIKINKKYIVFGVVLFEHNLFMTLGGMGL